MPRSPDCTALRSASSNDPPHPTFNSKSAGTAVIDATECGRNDSTGLLTTPISAKAARFFSRLIVTIESEIINQVKWR